MVMENLVRTPPTYKSLVLLSGGMDSTSMLAWAIGMEYHPAALSFRYGSRHEERETEAAIAVAEYFSVDHRIIDLPEDLFKGSPSALFDHGVEVPERPYPEEGNELVTEVPGRNGIFLSVAAAVAAQLEATTMFFAAHKGDYIQWPYRDCHPLYIRHMAEAIRRATDITLIAPFIEMTKAQIVSVGAGSGAPFELTYSCYKGGEIHCGVCATCIDRKKAFEEAGVNDPTDYLE